jgi:hypothetical protein
MSTETGHAVGSTGDAEKEAVATMFLEFWYGDGFHIYQNPRQNVPGQRMDSYTVDILLPDQIIGLMDSAGNYKAQPLHFGFMPDIVAGSRELFQEMLVGMSPEVAAQTAVDLIASGR